MFQVKSALLCMALASILTFVPPLANIGGEYPPALAKNGGGNGGGHSGKGGNSGTGGNGSKGTNKSGKAKGLKNSLHNTSPQVSKSKRTLAKRKVKDVVEPRSKAKAIAGKGRRTEPEITGSLPPTPAIEELPLSAELMAAQKQLVSAQKAFNAALADSFAKLTKLEQAIFEAEQAVIEAGAKLAQAGLVQN
jgi:hypothetical protein